MTLTECGNHRPRNTFFFGFGSSALNNFLLREFETWAVSSSFLLSKFWIAAWCFSQTRFSKIPSIFEKTKTANVIVPRLEKSQGFIFKKSSKKRVAPRTFSRKWNFRKRLQKPRLCSLFAYLVAYLNVLSQTPCVEKGQNHPKIKNFPEKIREIDAFDCWQLNLSKVKSIFGSVLF